MTDIPPVTELMSALNFTAEDLLANRTGRLSARQQTHLRAMQRRSVMWGIGLFVVFAFGATIFLFLGQQNASLILSVIGGVLVVCNAIAVGLFGRQRMRLSADLRYGQVAITLGAMERVIRPVGRVGNYVLRIEGIEFPVQKDTFKLFRHGQVYALYSAPYTHVLLAAEPK